MMLKEKVENDHQPVPPVASAKAHGDIFISLSHFTWALQVLQADEDVRHQCILKRRNGKKVFQMFVKEFTGLGLGIKLGSGGRNSSIDHPFEILSDMSR